MRSRRFCLVFQELRCALPLLVLWPQIPQQQPPLPQTLSLLNVAGQVHTSTQAPVPQSAMVSLETTNGVVVAQQPVNPDGHFEFQPVPKRDYRLVVKALGYETVEKPIDSSFMSNVFIDVVLPASPEESRGMRPGFLIMTDSLAPKVARKEYEKGVKALENRDSEKAKASFEKAVAVYPCYARALNRLASILIVQHQPAPAEKALNKSIECDPSFFDADYRLAQVLNGEKRFKESVTMLDKALSRSPSSWQLRYQLAASYAGLGQYDKAEEQYLKVLSLAPSEVPPGVHLELADVCLHERAFDKAYAQMSAYLRVVSAGAGSDAIRKTMQELESSGVVHAGPAKGPESSPKQ